MSKSANPLGTKPVKEQSQKEFEAYAKHDQRRKEFEAYAKHDQRRQDIDRGRRR